jgi:hypothetical protein
MISPATDSIGYPADASGAYAAQARFDLGEEVLLTPVGRAEVYLATDDAERQAIRSRPSLPIYTVQWTPNRS